MSTTSTEEMRVLYRRWLPELWHAGPDRMATVARTVFTSDAAAHWSDGIDRVGPDEIAARVRETVSMFDDVSVALLRGPLVDEDMIAAHWEFSGTYVGGVPGIGAPRGTRVVFTGMDLFRVEGDLVAEYWPYGNDLHLLRQLDALG